MIYLEKTWVRILLSLLIGGIVNEISRISSGQANAAPSNNDSFLTVVVAVFAFIILSKIVKNRRKY